MPEGEVGPGEEPSQDPHGSPPAPKGAHAAGSETSEHAGRSSGGVWVPPSRPAHAAADGDDANVAAERWTSIERAKAELRKQGLEGSPKKTGNSRRLVVVTGVILAALVILLGGSLALLGDLSSRITTTTFVAPSTSSTTSTTSTTSPSSTTPTTSVASGRAAVAAEVASFTMASKDVHALDVIGTGGQPVQLLRTSSRSWITAPAPTFTPIVVYLWSGSGCIPCTAQNLVVASSLEAIGGTFHGLAPLTNPANVASIDLHSATYEGPVILQAAELYGPDGRPAQTSTHQADAQFNTYDRRPFTTEPGSLPFLDVGGHFVMVGAGFAPTMLDGISMQALDADLTSPTSALARAVLGNANLLTASICSSLGALDRPLPGVCVTDVIEGLETKLPTTAASVAR